MSDKKSLSLFSDIRFRGLFVFNLLALILFVGTVVYFVYAYNNYAGTYNSNLNVIILYPDDYPAGTEFTVAAHEIGHYVYFQKLTKEQRDEWREIYEDSNSFISEYASTNELEDFAEMYAGMTRCYVAPSSLLDYNVNGAIETKKYEFINKYFEDMSK